VGLTLLARGRTSTRYVRGRREKQREKAKARGGRGAEWWHMGSVGALKDAGQSLLEGG
jgi:hypothetical protein